MHDEAPEAHDLGLAHDLPQVLNRRRALGLLSGAGLAAALAACGVDSDAEQASTGSPSRHGDPGGPGGPGEPPPGGGGPGGAGSNVEVGDGEIPEETGGPFPADGSNGVNVLTESGIVRSDIRASFGEASGVAQGVPLTVTLTLVDVSGADDPGSVVKGATIYAWHCDREGNYSMYSPAAKAENYLRGVQATDAKGQVSFTTIFPAAYSGRWPHIHFEVYPSLADAQKAQNKQRTSQLAFPEDVCNDVYATDGYESSVRNMARTSLEDDMVFSDGHSLQMAKVTGSVEKGYVATLRVPI